LKASANVDSAPQNEYRWPDAPQWLDLVKARSARCINFFLRLQLESVSEEEAEALTAEIISWGGVYPKLAQRLRNDKAIIRSETLRKKLARVMESCKSREEGSVISHILENYSQALQAGDVEFVKNLGTGSVAQVSLVNIKNAPSNVVMKMTWPEDEASFKADFEVFEWLRSKWFLPWVLGDRTDVFATFLTTVLTKKDEILNEFDLSQEAVSSQEGKEVVARVCEDLMLGKRLQGTQIKVPDVKAHSKRLLQQEYATGDSLVKLWQSPGPTTRKATFLYLEMFVPILGRLLFNEGIAHADAHSGNLIYDDAEGIFWIIDWGAVVRLGPEDRHWLQQLVIEFGIGEALPLDSNRVSGAADAFAGGSVDVDLWRHLLDPAKCEVPAGFDLQEFEKSITDKPELVLTIETLAMQGQMVKYVMDTAEDKNLTYWLKLAKPSDRMSLLTQWDTMASWNLFTAVKAADLAEAKRLVRKGQSVAALESDSQRNLLSVVLEQNNLAMLSALQQSWERVRPDQSAGLEALCPGLEAALQDLANRRCSGKCQYFARQAAGRTLSPMYSKRPAKVPCDDEEASPALMVSGAGGAGTSCNGKYRKSGRLKGMQTYIKEDNPNIIFWKESNGNWKINDQFGLADDLVMTLDQYAAYGSDEMEEPPLGIWSTVRDDNEPPPVVTWEPAMIENGTELVLISQDPDWCEARLPDGSVGFIRWRDVVTVNLCHDEPEPPLDACKSSSERPSQDPGAMARIHSIHDEHYSSGVSNDEFLAIRCAPPVMRERSRQALEDSDGNINEAIKRLEETS